MKETQQNFLYRVLDCSWDNASKHYILSDFHMSSKQWSLPTFLCELRSLVVSTQGCVTASKQPEYSMYCKQWSESISCLEYLSNTNYITRLGSWSSGSLSRTTVPPSTTSVCIMTIGFSQDKNPVGTYCLDDACWSWASWHSCRNWIFSIYWHIWSSTSIENVQCMNAPLYVTKSSCKSIAECQGLNRISIALQN